MPINRQAMVDGLQGLYTRTDDAANAWADAIVNGFTSIVPASTTVAAAKPALIAAIKTAFEAPSAAAGLEAALAAFAGTVGGGMAGAGFTATVPPAAVGFATMFAGAQPATRADSAARIADKIIAWAKTGLGTPASGTAINWS
jgi:hypothetical protein